MSRLYPVAGAKERARYRECLIYVHCDTGEVLRDRVHPRDHQETTQRLWAVHGRGSIRMTARRMRPAERYATVEAGVMAS